jgi:hypothetical protein
MKEYQITDHRGSVSATVTPPTLQAMDYSTLGQKLIMALLYRDYIIRSRTWACRPGWLTAIPV